MCLGRASGRFLARPFTPSEYAVSTVSGEEHALHAAVEDEVGAVMGRENGPMRRNVSSHA